MSLVHLTSFHDPCMHPPTPPSQALTALVCHTQHWALGTALPLAPTERGNGTVQPFTSPALRLTESIKQTQLSPTPYTPPTHTHSSPLTIHPIPSLPPSSNPSPHLHLSLPLLFLSLHYARPNYYSLEGL